MSRPLPDLAWSPRPEPQITPLERALEADDTDAIVEAYRQLTNVGFVQDIFRRPRLRRLVMTPPSPARDQAFRICMIRPHEFIPKTVLVEATGGAADLLDEIDLNRQLWRDLLGPGKPRLHDIGRAIAECRPAAAPALARFLPRTAVLSEGVPLMPHNFCSWDIGSDEARKVLASLFVAGFRLDHTWLVTDLRHGDQLMDFGELIDGLDRQPAHVRIAFEAGMPSLADLLALPPEEVAGRLPLAARAA